MSKILKRPMFRIGGQANEEGIVSIAAPRKNYKDGGYDMEAIENVKKAYREAAGPSPSRYSDLGDMLVSGGLNILSGKSAGKIRAVREQRPEQRDARLAAGAAGCGAEAV